MKRITPLMSAADAKFLSSDKYWQKVRDQLSEIALEIEISVNNGKMVAYWSGDLHEEARDRLEKNGYKVYTETGTIGGLPMNAISWKDAT